MDIMELESVMLRLNQKPRLMLSMDMVLGTALILWDMVMDILATLPLAMVMDMVLAMALMDMESVKLTLSQRLMPMLSMALMEDMVLDTVLMVMEILATLLLAMAMDMVMDIMDTESVKLRLSQRLMPMLSMALMEDMVLATALMVTEILATLLLVMVMAMVLAMKLTDMESVKLRLSQRLMPMLSMALMEDMGLDIALIL